MNKKSTLFILSAMCFSAFLIGSAVSTISNAQDDSVLSPASFTPQTFSFLKNLNPGDNNQDVRQLQLILNSDPATQITVSGVGSKGQESTYFGQLTVNAVKRFQAKYKKEILDPYNIYEPTGLVGTATRNKLNSLIKPVATTTASMATSTKTSVVSGPLPLGKESLPRLYATRPQQIKKGDVFSLVGAGFELDNTIHIGSQTFTHVTPQDGYNISFVIPSSSFIQNGTYEVWVENSNGTSRIPNRPINLLITDNPKSPAVISSVSPASVSGTEQVTVIGSGFDPVSDIVSGFGTIKNVSSGGNQITFSPRSLLSADAISKLPAGKVIKVDFYVVGVSGPSNVFGSVNLKI